MSDSGPWRAPGLKGALPVTPLSGPYLDSQQGLELSSRDWKTPGLSVYFLKVLLPHSRNRECPGVHTAPLAALALGFSKEKLALQTLKKTLGASVPDVAPVMWE